MAKMYYESDANLGLLWQKLLSSAMEARGMLMRLI